MKYINRRTLLFFLVNVYLVIAAFKNFFLDPSNFVFYNDWDGLKNYFTFFYYLTDKAHTDFLGFHGMNYPFGDNVFYTDQTPFISVPLKMLFQYFPTLSKNAIEIYNWIMVLNMFVAPYLCYAILKRFITTNWMLITASLFLPWLSPQYTRLFSGHLNLSLSCVVLTGIYLLIKMYEAKDIYRLILYSFLSYLLLTACFFIHGYYIFILASLTGFFAFASALIRKEFNILIAGGLVSLGSLLSVSVIMNILDQSRLLRSSNTILGYNADGWQMHLGNLFTSYSWNFIRFPFAATKFINYETYGYLGSCLLYSLLFIAFIFWWKGDKNKVLVKVFSENNSGKLLFALTVSGLFCGIMSFGETSYSMDGNYIFYNMFNPSFYLRQYIPELSHIRCMSRYIFPFLFTANIAVLSLLNHYWGYTKNYLSRGVIILLLVLGLSDARDAVNQMNRDMWAKENPFTDNALANLQLPIQQYSDYQSVLFLPFFHVGANNLTIEAVQPAHLYSFQVAIKTGLPLMNSQMSRTPDYQATAFANMFLSDSIPSVIQTKLNEKPILVILDKKLTDTNITNEEPGSSVFKKAKAFPMMMGMEILKEDDRRIFYKWNPKLKT